MKKPALEDKETFNPEEAIAFYGLSRRRFYRLLSSDEKLPFVAMYKTRKLIIRSEFESYLRFRPEKKEELKNGRPRISQKA